MSALVLRELRLAFTGGSFALPLVFFLLVATLFPFAVGPDAPLLARTGGEREQDRHQQEEDHGQEQRPARGGEAKLAKDERSGHSASAFAS